MSARLLRSDAGGYSLVEVMASIVILTLAIIPMVGMFDMGLNTAARSGNYDEARALAKKHREMVSSLPYATAKANVPNAPCTFDGSGLCESVNRQDPDATFSEYRYTIRKQFVELDGAAAGFVNSSQDQGYTRVSVVVGWGDAGFDDTTYTATSIKAK